MSSNNTKLYTFSFLIKKIEFEPYAKINGKVTTSIKFLRYREQIISDPESRPDSNVLNLNVGKSFTFGLCRDMVCDLARKFIIYVNLDQVDPNKRLSEAQIDVTKSFKEIFSDGYSSSSRAQVKTIVQFQNNDGNKIAHMEVILRLSPSGKTIINEFSLDGNVENQFIATTKGCRCPKVPDLKIPCKKHNDEDEWGIVGAELNNGQKIAIKFKKKYFECNPSAKTDKPSCENHDNLQISKSEEKVNSRMFGLLNEMHKILANAAQL